MRHSGPNRMNYFFDSYAIIEIIKNNANYNNLKDIPIVTSSLNIAEVNYFLLEFVGEIEADKIIQALNINLMEQTKEIAVEASKFRFENKKLKLSYADCLGYCTSLKNNLLFVTGDDAFRNFEGVEFIK